MNIAKLFDWSYLTHSYVTKGFSWPMRIILLIIFIGVLIFAWQTATKIKKTTSSHKRLWEKLQIWSWFTGLLGLLLMFFREVRTIYLGSRIWLLLLLIIVLIWLLFIIYYWKITIPLKEQSRASKNDFDKWLPKKKKK